MRFRSRRRVEAIRAVTEIAAGVEARLRGQLDGLERTQAMMAELLRATRADLDRRESDSVRREADLVRREAELVRTWERVAQICEGTVESIGAERLDRQVFLGALRELVAVAAASRGVEPAEPSPHEERVLGGTVLAPTRHLDLVSLGETDDLGDNAEVQVVETVGSSDTPVEVRGRFDDGWVGGFQVCGVVDLNGVVQYQLRRSSDGTVLPELFDAADIRSVDEPLPVRQLGLWTRE